MLPEDQLCQLLRQFYGEARKENGDTYSKSSLCNIRAGIQRYLSSPPFNRTVNIIRGAAFQSANNVFNGTLNKMKRAGEDSTMSHPRISEEDMDKLFASNILSSNNPTSLQRLVFFQLQYMFCRRGREGLRSLKKDAFAIQKDASGRQFIRVTFNEHEKNHPGMLKEKFQRSKRVYEIPGDDHCPVKALQLYLSKLNPKCEWFYQRPKKAEHVTDGIWYDNVPVGHNTIGNMMKAMSKQANLSKLYTNHSIRATAISVLNDAGVGDRIICSLSGHRNMGSLRSYCSDASEGQKRSMSDVLAGHGKNAKRKTSASCTISTPPLDDNSAAEVAPATVTSVPSSSFLHRTATQPPVITSTSSLDPATVTLPSVQPSLSSQIVRRAPMPTSTTIQNFRMHQVQDQQGHPVFAHCNFQGATLNINFGPQ